MIARILALSVMSAAATLAHAGTPAADDVPSVKVHYADLDLSTSYGAATLYKRIEGAARQVCPSSNALNLRAANVTRNCMAQAIERAVADVNSPQLARLSALRTHRTQG
ncbi:MAG TPA: UrcA family protein [Steroidobacteraceae bacterium]|jgi:UrcA family protein|nr:UrcA family protein [Steroidobacteraceae bacterium]